jgi:predicted DNA-binding antitoxin AbrB/MazE fold protein
MSHRLFLAAVRSADVVMMRGDAMAIEIRAIYENGLFRPLDPVDLAEGQEVTVSFVMNEETAIRAALGDLVHWHDLNADIHPEIEDEAQAIEDAFRGLRPLSEIIIEERNEQQ